MAVLRLRDEADCLSSNRTEQSLRPHPSAGHRSKSPYRASGLVPRPGAVLRLPQERPLAQRKADDYIVTLHETGSSSHPRYHKGKRHPKSAFSFAATGCDGATVRAGN